MHAAPPVRIPVVTDALAQGGALLCATWAAANGVAWALSWTEASAWSSGVVIMLAAGVAALLTWRALRRHAAVIGLLAWDTASWHWAAAGAATQPGRVQVMIDLGPWMLLRFNPVAPRAAGTWLAISRGAAAGQWPAWRAALYAATPEEAVPMMGAAA